MSLYYELWKHMWETDAEEARTVAIALITALSNSPQGFTCALEDFLQIIKHAFPCSIDHAKEVSDEDTT
jgi:hypothetical protein